MSLTRLREFASHAVKTIRKKDDTVVKINDYLKALYNKPIDYVQKPSYSPSTLGTKCFRKIYYQYFRVEKDIAIDAKAARIFETGNSYEKMVMAWLKAIGEHVSYRKPSGEVPLDREGKPNPQFPITSMSWRINKGFIDNVAVVDGKLWLYEIKSSSAFKFGDLMEPQDEHKDQTAVYFKAFNEHLAKGDFKHLPELEGHEKAAGVKIFYVNKDTSDIKAFTLDSDEVARNVQKLEAKIKHANEYIDVKQLPPKTPDKCSYCPFQKKCNKDWNGV